MTDAPSLSSLLMNVMEQMSPFLGLAAGYRERAIEMGFEPAAATAMAVQLHHYMLSSLMREGQK